MQNYKNEGIIQKIFIIKNLIYPVRDKESENDYQGYDNEVLCVNESKVIPPLQGVYPGVLLK